MSNFKEHDHAKTGHFILEIVDYGYVIKDSYDSYGKVFKTFTEMVNDLARRCNLIPIGSKLILKDKKE